MQRLLRRYIELFSLMALLVLVLAACDPEEVATPEVTSPSPTPDTAVTESDATPDGDAVATPDDGTPVATPDADDPVATPDDGTPVADIEQLDLQSALENLLAQESFEMTVNIENLPGALGVMLGMDYHDSATMIFQNDGEDRHVEVRDQDGNVIAEIWHVDKTGYVDIGEGPFEVSPDDPVLGDALMLAHAHEDMLMSLEDSDADYTVTGTEEVGGTETTVAEATFSVQNMERSLFFPEGEATIHSTIWVAEDGGHLVRAEIEVHSEGEDTPEPLMIEVNVTNIGEPITIQAPIGV